MRRYSILTSVGWPLLGLLAIAGMLMALGRREVEAFPAYDSYGPSGTAAFAELLRREGYQVGVDRRQNPRLGPDDVAIVFTVEDDQGESDEADNPFLDRLSKFVQQGGHVLAMPLQRNFQAASREAMRARPQRVVQAIDPKPRSVSISKPDATLRTPEPLASDDSLDLWTKGGEPYVRATRIGQGQSVEVLDGILATNRFIADADNAAVLSAVVRAVAGPGRRIVFSEAGFGNGRNPSLISMLGRWAAVAWYQFLFLMAVIAFSLGRRFGIAEEDRVPQRGTRELVDAIATTYRRGRMAKVALKAALVDTDERIRRAWRVPHDASEGERDRVLPEDLKATLRKVEVALNEPKLSPTDALSLANELHRKLRECMP